MVAFASQIDLLTNSDPVDEEISITALRAAGTAAPTTLRGDQHMRATTAPTPSAVPVTARPHPGKEAAPLEPKRQLSLFSLFHLLILEHYGPLKIKTESYKNKGELKLKYVKFLKK